MVNWKTAFDGELAVVFADALKMVAAFPEPMAGRGLAYVEKFNPLLPGSTKNYICYLLPFWLQELAGADAETCRRLALANVFVMLYFFVQDDLMDTAPPEWKEQLALANMFYLAFLDIYRSAFAPDSPFWDYCRAYIADWAVAVATEASPTGGAQPSAGRGDLLALAGKAAPVKLASTGALLIAGKEERIAEVSVYIDETLSTLQMVDDLADWRADLAENSGNSLLELIRGEQGPANDRPLTEPQIERSIAVGGSLERFAAIASARHERLQRLASGIPCLLAFHETLAAQLLRASRGYSARKQSMLRGGFANWLAESARS